MVAKTGVNTVLRKGTARLAAQLNQTGNGEDHIAALAESIETTAADDSLATENSLLMDRRALDDMEYSRRLYILMWPVMIFCALLTALKLWPYRLYLLFIRPDKDAEEELAEWRKRWFLGPPNALWLFDSHWLGKMVRNGVTTSEALDGIYAVPVLTRKAELNTLGGRLVRFWLNQPDGQAVRNRLRITYGRVLTELCRMWEETDANGPQIRILSLACGSAQATIEAVAVFLAAYANAKGRVELHLVDRSGSSLLRATHLAQVRGVATYVTIHSGQDAKAFLAAQRSDYWDIVEMVGFLDYRPWKSAVAICLQIRRVLKPGAMFITAHIGPSAWSFVVRWVINWPMLIRRTIPAFRRILTGAGFTEEEVEIVPEPHKIHPVAVCRKLSR